MPDFVYLDANATTRPDPAVVEAMVPFLSEHWGNPSSVHTMGQRARAAIDEARARVAGLLGCRDSEITFTGSGTEATATALRSLAASRPGPIVTTAVEHSATHELCNELERQGRDVIRIGVDEGGNLDMNELADALTDETAFVSTLWANNETGVLFDVDSIGQLCKAKRVPFHCDLTQVVGKLPVKLAETPIDCATLAAHKFHGPKGIGVLYARRGFRVAPLLLGSQERDRRGGTENVAGIVGTGVAAKLAGEHLDDMERVAQLRDDLESRVLAGIDEVRVNGDVKRRLPNTSNLGFKHAQAEAILLMLSQAGIGASAGAACSSGSLEPSHVLKAMRVPEALAHGSVRFSLDRFSTRADVDRLIDVLPGVIERLRGLMPTAAASA